MRTDKLRRCTEWVIVCRVPLEFEFYDDTVMARVGVRFDRGES